MKTLIRFAIVATCAGLVAACVDQRPIRNGLRDALRKLNGSDFLILLDRAIDLMSEELLPKWIEKHVLPGQTPRSDTPPGCALD